MTRTVGWFTTQYPVSLRSGAAETVWGRLRTVKAQLRGMPHRGLGYGVWRYLQPEGDVGRRLAAWPPAEVSFNYLGQFDQVLQDGWLTAAHEAGGGRSQSVCGERPYVWLVLGSVRGGQLEMEWQYSVALHTEETATRLAHEGLAALRVLLAPGSGAQAWSAVDFPQAHLPAVELARL